MLPLRSKALPWEKRETFWVKCGLNADPLQSFCGLMSSYYHQNSKRSLKKRIYDNNECVHYGRTGVYFLEINVQGGGPLMVDTSLYIF